MRKSWELADTIILSRVHASWNVSEWSMVIRAGSRAGQVRLGGIRVAGMGIRRCESGQYVHPSTDDACLHAVRDLAGPVNYQRVPNSLTDDH